MGSRILKHVDFERANALLENFNKATGFVTAIVDLDGNILSQSGWRQICTDYHRKNADTARNCTISDTELAIKLEEGKEYHFYKCINGLIDAAVPIVIRGEHIANLFSGQFFFDEPDVVFFKKVAQTYGFDEKLYLEALNKVPVVSHEKVESALGFLLIITQTIIEMTAERLDHIDLIEELNRREADLIERQTQLKQKASDLLESQRIAHVGTWRLDLPTNHVVWSEELFKMYGFDPDLPPPPFAEHAKLFTPESWNRLEAALNLIITQGIPYELELQTVTSDGSNGWMWVRGEAETDSNGSIVALWGAAQDITERKRIETELKQSEERFQLLFEKAPLGYQSLDVDGHFIVVNQQWLDTLGYSREDVIGKWFGDFLCPEYVDGFLKRFPIFKAQGFIHSEFEMLTKNGNRLYLSFEGRVGYDTDGNFVQTHCILQDITNQKKAESALKESEFVERLLLEHLQVAIVVHNTDSSISFCNPLAEKILGLSVDQVQNKLVSDKAWHFCDIFGEPLLVDAYPFSLVYKNESALVDYEMGIVFEDSDDIRWVMVNGFNIKGKEGNILKVLISFVDTTEKKIAEQALLESEERYKYLFENSGVGIGYYTTDGTVISYNQKALENIGGRLEDYVGKSIRALFPNEEAEIYFARIKHAISSDKPQEYLDHLVMNSAHKWFSSVFTRVTGASGQIIGVQIASLDVSDRKLAEETAIDNAFKFQSLFDEISTGAAIYKVINDGECGQDYIIQGFNKAALKGEGKELAEVLGKSLYDLRPNIDQYGIIPVFQNVWKTGKPEFFPSKIYIDEKFSNWYENRVYKLTSGEIVALFDDVTEKKRAEENIEYLAYHDYLTDAYNRRYFENEYADKNTGKYYPLAIVSGDLNGLKLINDSFGHHSGDLAIQQFATDIRKQIPKDAVLARIGGDEFAVLLTRNSEAEAKKLAGELQSSVQIQVKDNKGHAVDAMLTATFGYSSQTFQGQDMDELVKEVETHINRRKFLENTSKRSNVIDAIMSTLFEKSEREQQHSIRVSSIATAIATEMGLDDATVAKTRVAGALHDIGKIGIDESILNKSERLSDQEWELVKEHTIRSARILASVDEYLDIVPIVKAHHERIDGCGYPAGLTEKQIPIEAKIIAVADSFDAMTVSRPYRDAISKKLAADELKRCVGSQFDSSIVEIFISKVMPHLERGTAES